MWILALIRVRAIISGVNGLPGLMTAYFTPTGALPVVADVNDVTGRVRSFWVALVGQLAAGTSVAVQQSTDTIDELTGALLGRVSAASAPTTVTATGTGELPPSTALGIRLVTNTIVVRRLLQGRIFVSPCALATSNSGLPAGTAVTQGNVAGAALLSGATACKSQVWHRPTPGGSDGTRGDVLSATTDSAKLWVLRSRRD